MKKALITGITGMVGSHLADFLLENTDWEVYGVCRWRSPLDNVEHLLDRVNKKDRIFFDYADLNDEMSLITVIKKVKPDYVFHLAAQSYPLTSFTAPIDTLNTNILGTCRLLEAIHLEMEGDPDYKPVIHVCASSEVFGKIPHLKSLKLVFMKSAHSIRLPHMLFPRSVQTFLGAIMQRHMV